MGCVSRGGKLVGVQGRSGHSNLRLRVHLAAGSSSLTLKKHKSYYLMSHRAIPAVLLVLLLFAVLPHAQDPKPASPPSTTDGDLQLLDLSDLLKALNMTEADLANLTPAASTPDPKDPVKSAGSSETAAAKQSVTASGSVSSSISVGAGKESEAKDSSSGKTSSSSSSNSGSGKSAATVATSSYGNAASQQKSSDSSTPTAAPVTTQSKPTPASTPATPAQPKTKVTPATTKPIPTPTVTSTDNPYKTTTTTQIKQSKIQNPPQPKPTPATPTPPTTTPPTTTPATPTASAPSTPAASTPVTPATPTKPVPATPAAPTPVTPAATTTDAAVQTDTKSSTSSSVDDFALSLMDLSDLEALLGLTPSTKATPKVDIKPKDNADSSSKAATEVDAPIAKPVEAAKPAETPKKVDAATQTPPSTTTSSSSSSQYQKPSTPAPTTPTPTPTISTPTIPAPTTPPTPSTKYPQLVDLGTVANSSLIIGPGPKDPSLPPVLDLSKFVIDYNPGANKSKSAPVITDTTSSITNKTAQTKIEAAKTNDNSNLVVDFNSAGSKSAKDAVNLKPASGNYDFTNFFQPAGDTSNNNLLIDFANSPQPKPAATTDISTKTTTTASSSSTSATSGDTASANIPSTAFSQSLPAAPIAPAAPLPPAQPTTAFSISLAQLANGTYSGSPTPTPAPKTDTPKADPAPSKPQPVPSTPKVDPIVPRVDPVPARSISNITIIDFTPVKPNPAPAKVDDIPIKVEPTPAKTETKKETAPVYIENKKEAAPVKKEEPKDEEDKPEKNKYVPTYDKEAQPQPKIQPQPFQPVQPAQPIQPVQPVQPAVLPPKPSQQASITKPIEQKSAPIKTPIISPENTVKVTKSNLNNIYLSLNDFGSTSKYYDSDYDYDFSQIPNLPLPIQRQSKSRPSLQKEEEPTANPPQLYQCWNTDNWAINKLLPSYKTFSTSFVVVRGDEYLSYIQNYLLKNYGNYLGDGVLIAAYRQYNSYSNSLEYQLVYETTFGTFNSILTYFLDTPRIQLKSLSVINYFILEVDYRNCLRRDDDAQNCKVCQPGYRNYMGRCGLFDGKCRKFRSDECDECQSGSKLSRGRCI